MGRLHEMMLEQIGVTAEYEHIMPSLTFPKDQNGRFTVPFMSKENPNYALPTDPTSGGFLLYDFSSTTGPAQFNAGEGSVRVGDKVYTEAEMHVGTDSATGTAEYNVLLQLAVRNGGVAAFQEYAINFGTWTRNYVAIPTP